MPVRGRVYGKQSGTAEEMNDSLRLWSEVTGDEGFFVRNLMNIKEF